MSDDKPRRVVWRKIVFEPSATEPIIELDPETRTRFVQALAELVLDSIERKRRAKT